jgi:hypothetical protein
LVNGFLKRIRLGDGPLRKLLVGAFAACISLCGPVHAQTPLQKIQADVEALKERAKSAQQFQSDTLKALAQLLAKQVAIEVKPDKEAAGNKVADAEARGLPKKLEDAADLKNFDALDPSVGNLVHKCVSAVSKAKIVANNYNFRLEGCTQKDIDDLKDGLLKQESDAVAAYGQCRSVIMSRAGEYKSLLPSNINDLDSKRLSELGKYPDPEVKQCAQDIDKAVRQLTQAKDAKALVSTAMTMAANVCFASGGNPYVCGAMLFVAVLMEIFDGSGGGKGKGPGDEDKDSPTGSGGSPTISAGPNREGEPEKEAREKAADQAVAKGPSGNLATPGGDPDTSCQGVPTGQIYCLLKSKSGSERFFGGDSLLARVARNPGPGLVVVCKSRDNSTIKGIAVLDRETNTYSAYGYTKDEQPEPITRQPNKDVACDQIVEKAVE